MRAESREHICFWNQATEVSEPYIGGVLQAPYCTAIELWEKHKMSWIDTCGLFIFCNIIKQICHIHIHILIQYTWCVHVFAQLLNKMFFSMLKRLGIRNLEKAEEWVGRQHYCWPEKKLCCTLGNAFKSLLFSSDCKVNMERVQNSIQVWTDQNSSFPSAVVVKGHKQLSNSQNTCSRPDF